MKELYTSPELKLLSFAPAERLANSDIDFQELLGGMGTPTVSGGDDVNVDISSVTLN